MGECLTALLDSEPDAAQEVKAESGKYEKISDTLEIKLPLSH